MGCVLYQMDLIDNMLYLISHICVDFPGEEFIFRRFLKHYKSLGVEEFRIILHSNYTLENIKKYSDIMIEMINQPPKMSICFSVTNGQFSNFKISNIDMVFNNLKLTKNDWVVHTDSDEFQIYPGNNIPRYIESELLPKKYTSQYGEFVDMIPNNGILVPIVSEETVDLLDTKTLITKMIQKSYCLKVMLAQGNIKLQFGGNHKIHKAYRKYNIRHPNFMEILHYKWHGDIIKKMEHHIKNFSNEKNTFIPYNNFIEYYKKNGKIEVDKFRKKI